MGGWLQTFGMEIDEIGVQLQTISYGNGWNVCLGKNSFLIEIIENECLDENYFKRFPFYIIGVALTLILYFQTIFCNLFPTLFLLFKKVFFFFFSIFCQIQQFYGSV